MIYILCFFRSRVFIFLLIVEFIYLFIFLMKKNYFVATVNNEFHIRYQCDF